MTMPMDRKRYPEDWDRIAFDVKDAAGWRCTVCGKQCRKPGEPFDTHTLTLTVHHKDHRPENCGRENLVPLCAPCHLREERRYRAQLHGR